MEPREFRFDFTLEDYVQFNLDHEALTGAHRKLRLAFKHRPLPIHKQARVAARASLAAHAQGKQCTAAFTGTGFCFVEFGGDHAMGGDADFFALPAPRVTAKVPDLEQFQAKLAWAAAFLQNF